MKPENMAIPPRLGTIRLCTFLLSVGLSKKRFFIATLIITGTIIAVKRKLETRTKIISINKIECLAKL